jgi:hypothetical protein
MVVAGCGGGRRYGGRLLPGEERRQEQAQHDDCSEKDAEGHEGAELRQARQLAEGQGEERGGGGDGGPEDGGSELSAEGASGGMGLNAGFLVKNQGIIGGEAEEYGGEADAEDVQAAEEQSTQGKRADKEQGEQQQQPEQRKQPAVDQAEE